MTKSKSKNKKSPVKKLLIVGVIVAIAFAAKKALSDSGGSYQPGV